MAALAAGSVVLVPFPFSDLSQSKIRPALVLADAGRGDWILCQITSKSYADEQALRLQADDFAAGGLQLTSYIRPGKLFTANEGLMIESVGRLRADKVREILRKVSDLFSAPA
ncbi:MAG: type II toxin-antitoxin system PemK/MazF family toxin [Chthoniobacterales bacterium]